MFLFILLLILRILARQAWPGISSGGGRARPGYQESSQRPGPADEKEQGIQNGSTRQRQIGQLRRGSIESVRCGAEWMAIKAHGILGMSVVEEEGNDGMVLGLSKRCRVLGRV